MLRWNPHFHVGRQGEQQPKAATSPILLEGGFDEDGAFVYLPLSGLEKMTEYFRRTVLEFFTDKKLLTEQFAQNLLSWKHSGFSQDAWPSSELVHVPQERGTCTANDQV